MFSIPSDPTVRTLAVRNLTHAWRHDLLTRRSISRLLMGVVLLAAWMAGSPMLVRGENPVESFRGATMGTTYTVRVVGPVGDRTDLQTDIDQLLERVNDQMSTWREDSELSQFNQSRGTDWFTVSAATAFVISESIRISRETDGAFDATVGPLVNLWQFGPERRDRPPNEDELQAARQRVGYQLLDVQSDPPAIRKQHPECYVDLSGIAKGYGVDEVARLLEQRGFSAYLVEIGGEVFAQGEKTPGVPWHIGIESPRAETRQLQQTVELSGLALATSGDYRNVREIDGKWVSHTINPRTGRPVEHALASVTVVAPSCMEADALATALLVMGPEEAYDWVMTHDVAALLISRERGRGGSEQESLLTERASPRFAALFPELTFPGPTLPNASPTRGVPAMMVFLFALLIFGVAIGAMAVGVLFGRRCLRGSCGGLANFKDADGRSICEACHDPSPTCGSVEEGRRRAARDEKEEGSYQ